MAILYIESSGFATAGVDDEFTSTSFMVESYFDRSNEHGSERRKLQ